MGKLQSLGNGIYYIAGQKSSTIYYIDRKKGAVIDTGHPDYAYANCEILREAGVPLTNVKYIINTHAHPDHVGGTAFFKRTLLTNAEIVTSHKTQNSITRNKEFNLFPELTDQFEEFRTDLPVRHLDILDLGDDHLVVYETPGHAKDAISLYLPSLGMLFTGDTLYKGSVAQVDYNYDLAECLGELQNSYDIIKQLHPSLICPGHGAPFTYDVGIFTVLERKISKFFKNAEILLINNMIPLFELFFYKKPGIQKARAFQELRGYLARWIQSEVSALPASVDEESVVHRGLLLMSAMDMIRSEDDTYYLNGEVNSYL